jgi:photosystem II stability/assembly factor-like uncharacterized protein
MYHIEFDRIRQSTPRLACYSKQAMRRLPILVCFCFNLSAQQRLYTCMITSKDWVVGSNLPPSGIFFRPPSGEWRHAGFNHPNIAAADYDPRDPSTLFLAAGNGLIRASYGGERWKILTGSDVTELRDVTVDRNAEGTIYFAHTAGIRVSRDGGATWQELAGRLRRKYVESVRVDRRRAGRLLAGGEDGLFRSEDGGGTWQRAGGAGFPVMHIEQSPHDACWWLAVTERGGVFSSHDCGVSFENLGNLGVGRNLYDIAFDPTSPHRVAIAGWGPGVAVSEDGGKTWNSRRDGLPSPDVWSVSFDPDHSGRLYAGVHEEALYVSDDAGKHWRKDGLPGSIVFRMVWAPEGKQ